MSVPPMESTLLAADDEPFVQWLPSRAFWRSLAMSAPLGLMGFSLASAGWHAVGFSLLALAAGLSLFVGLMPVRFAMKTNEITLWWFGSRSIPFHQVDQASASRTRWGDYLHLTLESGEVLSILTRLSMGSAVVTRSPLSLTSAFPTELVSRVIAARAGRVPGRDTTA